MSKTKATTAEKQFEGWRSVLWPIHNFESKKFIPMGLIMFCLLFNYTLFRDTKDTLVINSAGANTISFLKLYCTTPAAIVFVILYAKLSNVVSREKLFHYTVFPFLLFFGLFGFVLYPNLDILHPSVESLESLHTAYPRLSGFIDIYGYWAYSLFYVMSEIWGSAMISLLFWQFANQITRTNEAKRFYGMFIVIGNVALILSGQIVVFCSETIKNFLPGQSLGEVWQVSLYLLMGAAVVAGTFAMYLYHWMYKNVMTDKRFYDPASQEHTTKSATGKKKKPGLVESLKIIFRSPELGLIALLVMAYGVSINLVEVQWKNQLGIFFEGDRGAYNAFMGNFSTVTGIAVIFFSLFVGQRLLRVFKWFTVASITPLLIALGGVVFFMFIFAKDAMTDFLMTLALNPVTAAAFLGAGIVVLSKGVKYSLFDPTKEMAYIPLDDELKVKGKAAVDVIGGRAGKAGGALTQSMLAIILATKDVVIMSPYTFGVFAAVMLLWLFAVKVLSGRYESMISMRAEEAKALGAAA